LNLASWKIARKVLLDFPKISRAVVLEFS